MNLLKSILVLAALLFTAHIATAQKAIPSVTDSTKLYVVTKNDGTQFTGRIILMDAHEVLINTRTIGQVSVPKHEIKEIKRITEDEISKKGEFLQPETFATRYFLTTNGLPIEKGESYILWNWFGPDIEFGVAKNFGIGIMTTWIGFPAIATAKYSIELDAHTHLGVGTLLGWGTWIAPNFGLAVPFASLTWGNRRSNFTISGGYGEAWTGGNGNGDTWNNGSSSGRVLLSVAGMTKIGKRTSLVFDSFILPGTGPNMNYLALYIPGLRIQTNTYHAFQFGFAGIDDGRNFTPIPMVQWFSKF